MIGQIHAWCNSFKFCGTCTKNESDLLCFNALYIYFLRYVLKVHIVLLSHKHTTNIFFPKGVNWVALMKEDAPTQRNFLELI